MWCCFGFGIVSFLGTVNWNLLIVLPVLFPYQINLLLILFVVEDVEFLFCLEVCPLRLLCLIQSVQKLATCMRYKYNVSKNTNGRPSSSSKFYLPTDSPPFRIVVYLLWW